MLPTDALGYEEIIVDVYPYGSTIAVKAIALRVAKHSKLQHDIAPSARYMDIIIKGAEELKLEPLYIQNLQSIPKAKIPKILETLARKSVFFTGFLFRQKLISLVRAISKISWFCYYGVPVSAAFFDQSKTIPVDAKQKLFTNEANSGRVASVISSGSRRPFVVAFRTLLSNLALTAIILPGNKYHKLNKGGMKFIEESDWVVYLIGAYAILRVDSLILAFFSPLF